MEQDDRNINYTNGMTVIATIFTQHTTGELRVQSKMNLHQGGGKSITDATMGIPIIYKNTSGTWRHS